MIGIPHILIPHAVIPHGTLPGDIAHYNVYQGLTRAELVFLQSVGVDARQVVVVQQAETIRYYGVKTVTTFGVESDTFRTIAVQIGSDGSLVGLAPNRVYSAAAGAVAAGGVRVEIAYSAKGQSGTATGVQIARRIAPGVYDWSSPLATLPVAQRGVSQRSGVLAGSWRHGKILYLAARAITAVAVHGPVLRLLPVTAKTISPPDVLHLEVSQI